MNTWEAINLFCEQLKRNITLDQSKTKIVLAPASINEKGLIIKISPRKTSLQTRTQGVRTSRIISLRLTVEGTAESQTGLKQALSAIEALDAYLAFPIHLEADNGKYLAGSRILSAVNPEDSFLDSPDSTNVQDVQDERTITITIPV